MHNGHRDRLKQRFGKEGLDNFEPHNILELVLFYAIPRKDTNEIAHRLIKTFGSLSAVMDAPIGDLLKVEGVGESAATLLKLIPLVSAKYQSDKDSNFKIIDTTESAGAFMVSKFIGKTDETVYIICLDSKRKVLYDGIIFTGNVNATNISIRKIVEITLRYNATSVIISHNHPGGIALPSKEDISSTAKMQSALRNIGIELIDHIVVADGDYVSFADSGFIKNE